MLLQVSCLVLKKYWHSPTNVNVDKEKIEYVTNGEEFFNSFTLDPTLNDIHQSDAMYSIAIIGRSGTGKTTLTKELVTKLSQRYGVNKVVFGLIVLREKAICDLVTSKLIKVVDHLQSISCLTYASSDLILVFMDKIETLPTKNNIKSTRESYLIICRINKSHIIIYDHVGFEGINSLKEFNSKSSRIGKSLLNIQYTLSMERTSNQFLKIWIGCYEFSVLKAIVLCAKQESDKSGLLNSYIQFHNSHKKSKSVKNHSKHNKVKNSERGIPEKNIRSAELRSIDNHLRKKVIGQQNL